MTINSKWPNSHAHFWPIFKRPLTSPVTSPNKTRKKRASRNTVTARLPILSNLVIGI